MKKSSLRRDSLPGFAVYGLSAQSLPSRKKIRQVILPDFRRLVEHSGFEPLTLTLPV